MRTRTKFPFKHLIQEIDECWVWTGHLDKDGYAKYTGRQYRSTRVSRTVYEIMIGPIPDGFVIDHVCRNRSCIRPSHLKAITKAENDAQGNGRKTECIRGHKFTRLNTRVYRGKRICRTCHREGYHERKLAAVI